MKKLTAVSLSPAIDKHIEFEHFVMGATNRVLHTRSEGSGKAVNVALSSSVLGIETSIVGLLGEGGDAVTRRLERAQVSCSFIPVPGLVRTNQKLLDRSTGITTEINEPTPEVPRRLLLEMADLAVESARESEIMVLTGSLPQKCPSDWYARVLRRVHEEAPYCRCVLDAEGEKLSLGVCEHPWLIKPNRFELELCAGRKLLDQHDIISAAKKLISQGCEMVAVSLGAEGAVLVTDHAAYSGYVEVEHVETTVGAGDAMVAGLAYSALFGGDEERMLACGLAAAAARVEAPHAAAHIDGEVFSEKLQRVQITEVPVL